MSKDFIKIARKINQLKKRISRDTVNPGHNSKLKTRIRKKRLQELQKSLLNGKKNSANRS
jgi:hypothetical protein